MVTDSITIKNISNQIVENNTRDDFYLSSIIDPEISVQERMLDILF